jgi:ATP adenylyltransferase
MERMFSPWRSQYIASFSEERAGTKECVLCKAFQAKDDDANLIVERGRSCYAVMNLYPYNSGHVMVVPFRHVPTLVDLTDEESLEVMWLLKRLTAALQKTMKPDGFNIGSNINRPAGAGIDEHVHFHLVPRWNGDTNFMPTLADTKLISEDIRATMVKLRGAL